MKRFVIIAIAMILFVSCEDSKTEKLKIYSFDDFDEKLELKDTACINATARAERDIKLKKILLHKSDFPEIKSFFKKVDVDEAIKQMGFKLDTISLPENYDDKGNRNLFSANCYQMRMRRYVIDNYDFNSIDSILGIAESKYVKANSNKVFPMSDLDGKYVSNEKGNDFFDLLDYVEIKFKHDFVYPEGYVFDKTETSSATIRFVLMKDGTIKNLTIKQHFAKPENVKFAAYFRTKITAKIMNEEWKPGYIADVPVNAAIEIVFRHK